MKQKWSRSRGKIGVARERKSDDLARTHPQVYATLLGKLLPAELKVEGIADSVPLVIIKDYTGGKGGEVKGAADAEEGEEV